jgi:predicted peptidase
MAEGQSAYTFTGPGGRNGLRYLLFLPRGYDAAQRKKWPVIFFLHGAAERGRIVSKLKKHGIPRIVEERPEFPFITVSPQCPENSHWGPHIRKLSALLDQVLETYSADPNRVYLTGISMGGNGVWHFAVQYSTRFAALAPVCGYGLTSQGLPAKVCVLKDVPTWIFHGAADTIVPLSESQILHDALRDCGGDVRLTIYPECDHDSWTQTYENPELYDWFLSHSLAGR